MVDNSKNKSIDPFDIVIVVYANENNKSEWKIKMNA